MFIVNIKFNINIVTNILDKEQLQSTSFIVRLLSLNNYIFLLKR